MVVGSLGQIRYAILYQVSSNEYYDMILQYVLPVIRAVPVIFFGPLTQPSGLSPDVLGGLCSSSLVSTVSYHSLSLDMQGTLRLSKHSIPKS